MFALAIPVFGDFERARHPDSSAVFMAGGMAEREGFEPDSGPQLDQQVGDSESDPVPTDPRKTP
jgi:hypothetical protein